MMSLVMALVMAGAAPVADPVPGPPNELDVFMDQVLERRKINWTELERYLFRERESFAITGPDGKVVESESGEFDRFVRDGELVRSPVRLDGVEVGATQRARYEAEHLVSLKKWREQRAEQKAKRGDGALARENFLDFNFEPGNYYFAGRELFEGREVLKIDYLPKRLFDNTVSDEDDDLRAADFSKTTQVTLWVLAAEHQILKVSFENVGLDFLPFRFLVRFGGFRATMIMDNAIGVWLPREISATGSATIANGRYQLAYARGFFDYRESDVGVELEYAKPAAPSEP